MKYLIGNWKSNKTIAEAKNWINIVKKTIDLNQSLLEIVVCPAFVHFYLFNEEYSEIKLGAQTISPYPDGAYTGAVSARIVKGLVEYVILGHSEQRLYFKETNTVVAQQALQAMENDLTPIIAVDRDNWLGQMTQFNKDQIAKIIVMYEPPEAISKPEGLIGKGEAAKVGEVVDMVRKIKQEFLPKAVIYGGSVKSQNIGEFLEAKEIDGVLPGSASLHPEEWVKMVKIGQEVVGR